MSYSLTFVKINTTSPFAGAGFAGNIMNVMNALLHIPKTSKLWIDMETNDTINTDETIKFTKNCWEYYFDQMTKPTKPTINSTNMQTKRKILYNTKKYTHTTPIIKQAKNLFYKNFTIKPNITNEVQHFYNKHFDKQNILGVQIRLTDMAHYHKVAGLKKYINKIKNIIQQQQIDKIFIATDDEKVFKQIENEINIPVLYQKHICRATIEAPLLKSYERYYKTDREGHRYLLGKEVLIDILLLSKCKYFLKADISSVSLLALIFSTNIQHAYNV